MVKINVSIRAALIHKRREKGRRDRRRTVTKLGEMTDEELAMFLLDVANDCIGAYYSNWFGKWSQYADNMKYLKYEEGEE